MKPIARRRNPKYDSNTPQKVVSNFFIKAYHFLNLSFYLLQIGFSTWRNE